MVDFNQFCRTCVDKGVRVAIQALKTGPDPDWLGLAETCLGEAEQTERRGDVVVAARLRASTELLYRIVQYKAYMELP